MAVIIRCFVKKRSVLAVRQYIHFENNFTSFSPSCFPLTPQPVPYHTELTETLIPY